MTHRHNSIICLNNNNNNNNNTFFFKILLLSKTWWLCRRLCKVNLGTNVYIYLSNMLCDHNYRPTLKVCTRSIMICSYAFGKQIN